MGIVTEYNPDLALRDIEEFKKGNRKMEECIPEPMEKGKIYPFLKKGQRHYWFFGEIPLRYTEGNEKLSKPLASVVIIQATHFIQDGEIWTKGEYRVVELFGPDDARYYFDGFEKVKA